MANPRATMTPPPVELRLPAGLPRFGWRAWRVWERNFLSWLKVYRTSLLLNFGEPLMNLLALGFGLGAYVARLNDVAFADFIAPGLLASTAMMGVSFDMGFSGYAKLHRDGVYDSMITGPMTIEHVVGGEILWETTRSLLYGSTFLVVITALGLVHSWWALLILPLMFLSGLIFAIPALMVATVARVEDQLFYYFTLVITPMFMFGGIFFPVERLPEAARVVIWLTPLYHLVNISRALTLGQLHPGLWGDLVWLVVFALLLLPWPVRLLRRKLLN